MDHQTKIMAWRGDFRNGKCGVVKKDNWRQTCPQDQLVTLLQAVQGDLCNLADGIGNRKKQIDRMTIFLKDCQEIVRQLPKSMEHFGSIKFGHVNRQRRIFLEPA